MDALGFGVGGAVGSGKTALVAELCRGLGGRYPIAAATNDIYTREDAEFLQRAAVLPTSVYVVDVSGGDKVPRKGGPGVSRSELLVVNKTDLAPLVGADLSVMKRDAGALRGDAPTLSVLRGDGMGAVVD